MEKLENIRLRSCAFLGDRCRLVARARRPLVALCCLAGIGALLHFGARPRHNAASLLTQLCYLLGNAALRIRACLDDRLGGRTQDCRNRRRELLDRVDRSEVSREPRFGF
jgi:hypothetical protein